MTPSRLRAFGLVAAICAVTALGACKTIDHIWKEDAANRLAVPANMHKRQIPAGPFSITVFERTYQKEAPATIYFEGDGITLIDKNTPLGNPTPDYPVGLHLATRDLSKNVIYIARPCQFSNYDDRETICTKGTFTDRRFSVEVMDSMNTVLDTLKSRYDLTGFNLVGYDGGAAVATLLAAKRDDVLSLRTVAGILDTGKIDAKSPAATSVGSLNPRDFAVELNDVPQHHFFGAWDKTVTPDMYDVFRSVMGPSTCARMSVVDEVDHEAGWVNRWPSLLKQPVDCNAP